MLVPSQLASLCVRCAVAALVLATVLPEHAAAERPAPPARDAVQDEWTTRWDTLRRLRNEPLPEAEAAEQMAQLEAASDPNGSAPARVLAELLARWKDPGDPQAAPRPGLSAASLGLTEPFRPRPSGPESWAFAEALGDGPARAAQVLFGLDQSPPHGDPLTYGRRLNLAWSVGVQEAREGRHEQGALPIQRRLHDLYPGAWSAMDLALTLGLLGRREEGDRVLAGEIERERLEAGREGAEDPELWNRRGLLALGVGHERLARNYLGRAVRMGSTNAAVVLARLDLVRGRREEALRGFRALSWERGGGAWTQRGYGLSLLSPRPLPPPAR